MHRSVIQTSGDARLRGKMKMSLAKKLNLSQGKMNLPTNKRPFSGFPRPPSEGQSIENEVKMTHHRFFAD
jgi:hypothetical protein